MVADQLPVLSRRASAMRLAVTIVRAVGGVAMLGTLGHVWVILTGRYLFTFGGAEARVGLDALPSVTHAEFMPGGDVFLIDIPLWIRLLGAAPLIIQGAIIAIAAVQVTRVVGDIGSGRPFDRPVLRALAALTLALLGGGILQGILATIAAAVVAGAVPAHLTERNVRWEILGFGGPDWPIMLILLGAVTAAISIAFRDGAGLQEETEGVV